MEDCVREILKFIGEDPQREGLIDTPKRVRKAWEFLCSGYNLCVAEEYLLKGIHNNGTLFSAK